MSSTSDERLSAAGGVTAAPRVVEVADGVFAYVQPDGSWWINNTGFIAGTRSCSASTPARPRPDARPTSTRSSASPDRAPRVLVNTHHHGDHTNGNCLLPFATIIGHERCRQAIMETGILRLDGILEPVEWGELAAAPPFVTFEERLHVYVDDLLVELHHFGTAAHTTNDVVAWIPERKVLFSGDLVFNGGTPFVLMGSVKGSLVALSRLVDRRIVLARSDADNHQAGSVQAGRRQDVERGALGAAKARRLGRSADERFEIAELGRHGRGGFHVGPNEDDERAALGRGEGPKGDLDGSAHDQRISFVRDSMTSGQPTRRRWRRAAPYRGVLPRSSISRRD